MGDRRERLELEKADADLAVADQGFIEGKNGVFWMSNDVSCDVRKQDINGNTIGGFDGCAVTGRRWGWTVPSSMAPTATA